MSTKELKDAIDNVSPENRHYLQCRRSGGALGEGLKPMVVIEGILHPVRNPDDKDWKPSTEPHAFFISIEDARVLKRTIDRTLAVVDGAAKN